MRSSVAKQREIQREIRNKRKHGMKKIEPKEWETRLTMYDAMIFDVHCVFYYQVMK
jgi:hypothetical protein